VLHEPQLRDVKITPLSVEARELLRGVPVSTDLGACALNDFDTAIKETHLEDRLATYRNHASAVFLVEWRGDRSPRGVKLGELAIGWTQNGVVTDLESRIMGTYEHLVESGGPNGRNQEMVVFVDRGAHEESGKRKPF
jgi:hypothetical protein